MANVLVTGSNGQLGSELKDVKFSVLDTLYFTDIDELDITSYDDVHAFVVDNEIDTIVNCAAYTAVDAAEDDSEKATLLNVTAVANLARIAEEEACLLIHLSTDYVFDGQAITPYNEKHVANPLNEYGRTKLEGEKAIKKSGCVYIILRTAWLYSAYGHNFMKTIDKLSHEKDHLDVVNDQIGTPTYAGDLALAIKALIEDFDIADKAGTYHFTNLGKCSWYDFACKIIELNHTNCKINPVTSAQYVTKAQRPHYSVLNKAKIVNSFDLEIPQWEDALAVCMAKYQKMNK